MHIFRHLFSSFQTSGYTSGEFRQNRNNSAVFEELSVSIVDLTVANIRFTGSNSSNTVLLILNCRAMTRFGIKPFENNFKLFSILT